MKKLFSLVLAVLMIATLSTTAFAANIDSTTKTNDGTASTPIDVMGKYVSTGSGTTNVISVDVTWGAMEFTYTEDNSVTWNPADHSYESSSESGWSANGNEITMVNHSNVAVTVQLEFTATSEDAGYQGSFDEGVNPEKTINLRAGVEGASDAADFATAKLRMTGTLSNNMTQFGKIGTITVTISQTSDTNVAQG